MQEHLSSVFVNNKGTDQPGHPSNLIRTFIIHLLVSPLSKLAKIRLLIFKLVSVAEEICLSLVLMNVLKKGFVGSRSI